MYWGSAILLLFLKSTVSYKDGSAWNLAFNIHGSDGHNFGYGADDWDNNKDVGTANNAFKADYKKYDVTTKIANFIAIVRHQNGVCEAARVWKFLSAGKTLQNYLDTDSTSRLMATKDTHIYSYISPTMKYKDQDPIFSVSGGLVFNWWYSINGVRIGNSKTYYLKGLPGKVTNDDSYHGIGNEFGAATEKGKGSTEWWHEVGVRQGRCWGDRCKVQGTDHGTRWGKSCCTLYGQYAIFTSDVAKTFPCKDVHLQLSVSLPTQQPTSQPTPQPTLQPTPTPTFQPTDDQALVADFNRIDRDGGRVLYYDEITFDVSDSNKDRKLSLNEYSNARAGCALGETAGDVNITTDFTRIDKDGDGFLNYYEVILDIGDINKDGKLSSQEYCKARANKRLQETITDIDVSDFQRLDRNGDGSLSYDEVAFDITDANKDDRLSLQEYSKARSYSSLADTSGDADVADDFTRIDRDGDGFVTYDELAFDIADTNKDGNLSEQEYSGALADGNLHSTVTGDSKTDFNRIDRDSNHFLCFDEIAFDIADTNKDGELTRQEYIQARTRSSLYPQ